MLRQKSRRYNGNGSYVPLKMPATSSFSFKQQQQVHLSTNSSFNKFTFNRDILIYVYVNRHIYILNYAYVKFYVQFPDLISIPVP